MTASSKRLEQEIAEARDRMTEDIEELRLRVTPGQLVDQITDYARDGAAGEFVTNLGREIRQNPLPLLLAGIGIGWLIVASSLSRSRRSDALLGPARRQPLPLPSRESYEWDEAADATSAAE
jgi:hypothetical protein